MNDQDNRLYAVNLLNRAEVAFDARDVGVLAKLIPLAEGDIADFLDSTRGVIGDLLAAPAGVRKGGHRPDLPQPHPASASLESNVR